MALIDTHTHLYLPEFELDRHQMVNNAIDAGISKMLIPNVDSDTIPGMLQLCNDFPDICYPMMGLHPCSVKENYLDELAIVKERVCKENYIAIGEIGIDLYWDKSFLNEQIDALHQQINLAISLDLPIVIHARDSFAEIFDILDQYKKSELKGVFHSFTGGLDEVRKIAEYDFYYGINGIVTFKNSGLDKAVKEIPLNRILLETDSPYLSPVPKRGKRNESSFLIYINDFVAGIYGISPVELAQTTSNNALKLFNLK